jgi:hypothetical protein
LRHSCIRWLKWSLPKNWQETTCHPTFCCPSTYKGSSTVSCPMFQDMTRSSRSTDSSSSRHKNIRQLLSASTLSIGFTKSSSLCLWLLFDLWRLLDQGVSMDLAVILGNWEGFVRVLLWSTQLSGYDTLHSPLWFQWWGMLWIIFFSLWISIITCPVLFW